MRSNFRTGGACMLTRLCEGQAATALQLPAQPATAAEADAQKRVAHVGWQFGTDLFSAAL